MCFLNCCAKKFCIFSIFGPSGSPYIQVQDKGSGKAVRRRVFSFSFSQEPDSRLPHPPTWHSVHWLQVGFHHASSSYLPHISKVIRHTPLVQTSPSNTTSHTLTHTPVDRQNGAGVRQHAGGTGGDHAVKWIAPFFPLCLLLLGWPSSTVILNPRPLHERHQLLPVSLFSIPPVHPHLLHFSQFID